MSTEETKMFRGRRERVRDYIMNGMIAQGATNKQADNATACVYTWGREDVDNLFNCIVSELPSYVIESIVAHDYNGLSGGYKDPTFLPKSSQFKEQIEDGKVRVG